MLEGDIFIVAKPDRITSSVAYLMTLKDKLGETGASPKATSLGLDTGNTTSKLRLDVLASAEESGREIMLERVRIGIIKAKDEGKYKERPNAINWEQVQKKLEAGMSPTAIACELSMIRDSVYRIKKELAALARITELQRGGPRAISVWAGRMV